jgi:beta-glucosidase
LDIFSISFYLRRELYQISLIAPRHALAGFIRTPLSGMQQQHIHVVIDPRSLSTASVDGKRSVEPGEYTVLVGGTQPDQDSGEASQGFTIAGRKELPR